MLERLPSGSWTLEKTNPRLEIDLSALGKGFAIDRVAEYLDRRGFESYLVEFGGELRARGTSARGEVWRVGLEEPDSTTVGRVRRRIALDGRSIATSGDYRTFFRERKAGSRVYSHIIDPRTGRPVSHGLTSVSVIHRSATRADGLATALMVLGPERGFDLAMSEGLAATFVVRTAAGLRERSTPRFLATVIGEPDETAR